MNILQPFLFMGNKWIMLVNIANDNASWILLVTPYTFPSLSLYTTDFKYKFKTSPFYHLKRY